MTVPHITIEQAIIMFPAMRVVPSLQRANELIDKANAEPHAELKAQGASGGSGLFSSDANPSSVFVISGGGGHSDVPIATCQVQNLDTGELKTMTREKAKLLQAELGDTVNWINPEGYAISGKEFSFDYSFGIYTYKLKAKPLKQIEWKDVPVGVAVQTVNKKLVCTFVGMAANGLISIYNKTAGADDYRAAKFELAPAADQPWIPVIAPPEGLTVEYSKFHECLRITGIAEGWKL